MSYYNRYRGQRNPTSQSDLGGGMDEPDAVFELGKNKRVTVRQFRNINLIDIREYYADGASGEMKPGKKGISLTEEVYDELLKHRQNIDDALRRFGSKRPRTKTVNVLSDSEETSVDVEPHEKETRAAKSAKKSERTAEKPKVRKERKRKEPAPPQAQPDEKRRRNDELESNAQLVIPGGAQLASLQSSATKSKPTKREVTNNPRLDDVHIPVQASNPRLDDHLHKLTPPVKPENDSGLDSSDEDFALALESEFNKDDDDDDDDDNNGEGAAVQDHTDGNISEES
ncbi:LAME_0H12574g1_1 [Lachancea meyersii CBS 8951]|uniref:LAME_0H12574g1_1 n=1 Tax=Lachancea meyersii CBS 8951 TaxID=1266667 RepID=A0A1G4KGR6_9SACH|nr:LAME_0H12574g1_1 [Lachancea meyersii CBS 8951]